MLGSKTVQVVTVAIFLLMQIIESSNEINPDEFANLKSSYKEAQRNLIEKDDTIAKKDDTIATLNNLMQKRGAIIATYEDKIVANCNDVQMQDLIQRFKNEKAEQDATIAVSEVHMQNLLQQFQQERADHTAELANLKSSYEKALEKKREDYPLSLKDLKKSLDAERKNLQNQVIEKDATISEKDATIAEKDYDIAIKDATIAKKDAAISKKDEKIADHFESLKRLKESSDAEREQHWMLIMKNAERDEEQAEKEIFAHDKEVQTEDLKHELYDPKNL